MGIKKSIDSISEIPLYELQENDFKIKAVHQIAHWRTYSADEKDRFKACIFYDYAPLVF